MTVRIDDLILSAEVELEQAQKARERALAEVKNILARAKHEGRPTVSEDEQRDIDAAFARREQSEKDIVGIKAKLSNAKKAKDAEAAMTATEPAPDNRAATPPKYDRVARVGREQRTYDEEKDPIGKVFLSDVAGAALRNMDSEMRLSRHMAEERVERPQLMTRAPIATSNFAGLVVPQYLTDLYVPATSNRRPFADICTKHPLPENGMSFNISRITTSTGEPAEYTEATLESSGIAAPTAMDDTLLQVDLKIAAGTQFVSRAALERGVGIEDVTMSDLYRRMATFLDKTLLQTATIGLSAVAQAVTYDDTSPTAAELWPKLMSGLSNAEQALLGEADVDYAVMHSRRLYWLMKELTSSWPFISQPGLDPRTGGANLAASYDGGRRAVLPNGLPVIVDNNVPTTKGGGTEDEIYLVSSAECHLWEDPGMPTFIRADIQNKLQVQLVLYSYYAYTFQRYTNGHSKVSGTGLIAPTF